MSHTELAGHRGKTNSQPLRGAKYTASVRDYFARKRDAMGGILSENSEHARSNPLAVLSFNLFSVDSLSPV